VSEYHALGFQDAEQWLLRCIAETALKDNLSADWMNDHADVVLPLGFRVRPDSSPLLTHFCFLNKLMFGSFLPVFFPSTYSQQGRTYDPSSTQPPARKPLSPKRSSARGASRSSHIPRLVTLCVLNPPRSPSTYASRLDHPSRLPSQTKPDSSSSLAIPAPSTWPFRDKAEDAIILFDMMFKCTLGSSTSLRRVRSHSSYTAAPSSSISPLRTAHVRPSVQPQDPNPNPCMSLGRRGESLQRVGSRATPRRCDG